MLLWPVFHYLLRLMTMEEVFFASPVNRNLTYREVVALMRKNEITIIDVRENSEIRAIGSIPGSINIPLHQLKEALSEISSTEFRNRYGSRMPKKTAQLVFICHSGGRSRRALDIALSLGFVNSSNYSGGYEDWRRNNNK